MPDFALPPSHSGRAVHAKAKGKGRGERQGAAPKRRFARGSGAGMPILHARSKEEAMTFSIHVGEPRVEDRIEWREDRFLLIDGGSVYELRP